MIGKALPIFINSVPSVKEGARVLPVTFDFTATDSIDLNLNIQDYGLSFVQGAFIDNSLSAQAFELDVPGTNQKIVVPPYSQAQLPIFQMGFNLMVTGKSLSGLVIPVKFTNIHLDLIIWSVVPPFTPLNVIQVAGTVTASPERGGYINRSRALVASGASEPLCALNVNRKQLIIMNPSTLVGQNIAAAERAFINFNAAAGVDDGVSMELLPGGSFGLFGGAITTDAVNWSAATPGHRIICKEM